MDIKEANEITAKACNVQARQRSSNNSYYFMLDGNLHSYKWTIEDPRCREVIREHYKIDTLCHIDDIDRDDSNAWSAYDDHDAEHKGKTIAAAEIACILAICEESK